MANSKLVKSPRARWKKDLIVLIFILVIFFSIVFYFTYIERTIPNNVLKEFNHIGFSTTSVNAPFDILAREGEEVRSRHPSRRLASYNSAKRIFTVVSNDTRTLKKKIKIVKEISDITGSYKICVSEKKQDVDIVLIKPDDLKEITNPR